MVVFYRTTGAIPGAIGRRFEAPISLPLEAEPDTNGNEDQAQQGLGGTEDSSLLEDSDSFGPFDQLLFEPEPKVSISRDAATLLEKVNQIDSSNISAITDTYIEAGFYFAREINYLYLGKSGDFETYLEAWEKAEKKYADLGFRTLSLDSFIRGFRGEKINGKVFEELVNQKLDKNEKPIFHSSIYRKYILGKEEPPANFEELKKGNIVTGSYELPSTEIYTSSVGKPVVITFCITSTEHVFKKYS